MKRALALTLVFAAACTKDVPQDRIRASGHVEATETRLAPEAGGRILTLLVKEGDRVRPGDTIVTLDTRDVQLAICPSIPYRGRISIARKPSGRQPTRN